MTTLGVDDGFRGYGDVELRLDNGRVVQRPVSECRQCAALVDSSWDARARHLASHMTVRLEPTR